MRNLEITVSYGSLDSFGGQQRSSPFAVEVLSTDAETLAEVAVRNNEPASIPIPDEIEVVYVRLVWPSGKKETKKVKVDGPVSRVSFSGAISRNEWAAWAVPRLGPSSASPNARGPDVTGFQPTLVLWRYDAEWNKWISRPAQFLNTAWGADDSAALVEVALDDAPHMLCLGGFPVPSKLVSLPAPGPCRILITPSTSTDPRTDPLKVAITGSRPDAEALVEYLARDEMGSAQAVASQIATAEELMGERRSDPLSAIAGAYFLLRTGGWRNMRPGWFEDLVEVAAPNILDSSLIVATLRLRQGKVREAGEAEWIRLVTNSVTRGMPVYAEAFGLLQECAAVLPQLKEATNEVLLDHIRSLLQARAWSGAMFSYYGTIPGRPLIKMSKDDQAKALARAINAERIPAKPDVVLALRLSGEEAMDKLRRDAGIPESVSFEGSTTYLTQYRR